MYLHQLGILSWSLFGFCWSFAWEFMICLRTIRDRYSGVTTATKMRTCRASEVSTVSSICTTPHGFPSDCFKCYDIKDNPIYPQKKNQLGVGEMLKWVKHLPYKLEDMSSKSQNPHKSQTERVHTSIIPMYLLGYGRQIQENLWNL